MVKNIHITVGLPGSGKDYYINKFLEGKNTVKINRDDIRTMIGGYPEYFAEEKRVSEISDALLEYGLKDPLISDIAISNTSVKLSYRNSIYNLAGSVWRETNISANYYIHLFLPDINACMCLQQFRKRQVPLHVLIKMAEQFVDPRDTEEAKFTEITVIDPAETLEGILNEKKENFINNLPNMPVAHPSNIME